MLPGPRGSGSLIRGRRGLTVPIFNRGNGLADAGKMTGDKEIERPLGQGLRPARGTRGLSSGAIVAAAVVLAVVGVSGAIALREKPFRKPQETAVSTPKVTAATEPVATPAPAVAPAAPKVETSPKTGGPQIIHVQTEEGDGPSKPAIVIRDPSTVGQNLKIAHIPDRALVEASDTGPLPIRAADGRRPFDVYARPWSGARGARVAIVIGGLAVSQTGTQAAIAKLPAEVTLAFAPQGNSIGRWMQAARQGGHEIVMQVPLEPFDYPNVNPGRNTLTVSATPEENLKALHWALSRTTNYTAVMNYMGARFSSDPAAMGQFMAELGKRGLAYVDDTPPDEMRAMRGTLTEPGRASADRDRSVETNLNLFRDMRAGKFPNGACVLRAKIDLASGNMNLRDPVLYRILHTPHPRTGTQWCIYPTYDFAHGQSDAIEHVTHSLCTLEFEDHRPLYDWFLDNLPVPSRPRQYEFARLNVTYTLLSKRVLTELVRGGHVSGWDDPRIDRKSVV